MDTRKPRHILTQEERARGHKLTREDRIKGAIAANRIRGARGGKAAHAKGTAHFLTSEDRRRGGLATAAKRRAARAQALVTLALDKASPHNIVGNGYVHNPSPPKRDPEPSQPPSTEEAGLSLLTMAVDPRAAEIMEPAMARALGASLAGKLFVHAHPIADPTGAIVQPDGCAAGLPERPDVLESAFEPGDPNIPPDAFTLSALKRFRLGPMSPLSLTRSQRAHIALMREAGYIETDGESMLRLTSKGRDAIKTDEES